MIKNYHLIVLKVFKLKYLQTKCNRNNKFFNRFWLKHKIKNKILTTLCMKSSWDLGNTIIMTNNDKLLESIKNQFLTLKGLKRCSLGKWSGYMFISFKAASIWSASSSTSSIPSSSSYSSSSSSKFDSLSRRLTLNRLYLPWASPPDAFINSLNDLKCFT